MSQHSSESPSSIVPAPRPTLAPATLVFVGVWAGVFATFIVLGLRT
jgi:hypothetical protein